MSRSVREVQDAARTADRRSLAGRLVIVVYLFLFTCVGTYARRQPTWEWDLLGYLGCVEELKGGSAEEVHRSVYAQVAEQIPPEFAEELRTKIPYRKRLTDDADAFGAQLRFYRGRVLYIGLLSGLTKLGIPGIRAAYSISVVAGLLLAWVVYLWAARHLRPPFAALISLLGLLSAGAVGVMSLATPDMLASSLVIAGAYCLIEAGRPRTGILLFLLAIATRVDLIVLIMILLLWATFAPREAPRISKATLATSLVLLLAVFHACTTGRDTHGWWIVYHHTFFGYKAMPDSETPALDLMLAAEQGVKSLPMFTAWRPLGFLLVSLLATLWGYRKNKLQSLAATLSVATLAALLGHFALIPALWPRLMLPYWILTFLALCIAWSENPGSRDASAPG